METMGMLKIEVTTCLVVTLLLTATPAVADATRDLARCENCIQEYLQLIDRPED
jgi:hypothetical protein